MPRAGLYARVSTEEQAEGYSIDAQLQAMRRFCQDRHWTVASEYVEPGVSGTTGDRPAFRLALEDAEQGQIDILVTHQLDRFARNLQLQLETLGRLGEWGVSYVSITEQIDYSTPQGALFLSMLGAFNEYYSANLGRETAKGKRARARSGHTNASTIPHGYRRTDDGNVVVDPDTAPAVTLAFESYSAGIYSDSAVARILTRAGHRPSHRARSGRWTREAVRYLLRNPFYTGLVRHGDDVYPGQHEPLVERQLYDRVQEIRARRYCGGGPPRRIYLLTGLAHCHLCRLRLIAETHCSKGYEYPYLRDVAARRGYTCPAEGRGVRMEPLEEAIGEIVSQLVLPADWRETVLEMVNNGNQREQAERERIRLQEKLRRLRAAWLEVDLDEATYRRERAAVQERLSQLIPAAPADVENAALFLDSLASVWQEATIAERRELLHTLLVAVRIDVLGGALVAIQPRPSFAPLFRQIANLTEADGWFQPEGG